MDALPKTKDGLRATCPVFRARAAHQRKYYLLCGLRRARFESEEMRDRFYRDFCCKHGCNLRNGGMK